MNKLTTRRTLGVTGTSIGAMILSSISAFAQAASTAADVAGGVIDDVTKPITDLINSLLTPVLSIVGALGTLFCVVLGVKYAKAEEPQDREKAKAHLKNAIIGFVLIFVLMLAMKLLMPALQKWVEQNAVVR